jgi:hypothetical protein
MPKQTSFPEITNLLATLIKKINIFLNSDTHIVYCRKKESKKEGKKEGKKERKKERLV